jgi:integrase
VPRTKKPAPKQANGAGSVFYRADRRNWRAMVTLPNGQRTSVTAPTKAEAISERNKLLGKVASGELIASGTVGERIEWWRSSALPARQLAPATVEQYEWALGVLEAGLGKVRLRALSAEQVEAFLGTQADAGYSRSSVNRMRAVLGQVLAEAERRGHVARNVARMAHLPASARPRAERRSLTAAESQRLLAAAEGKRLSAFFVLALTTGARKGELLGLPWSNVDLEGGTMTITQALRRGPNRGYEVGPTKTAGSVRTVRLAPSALRALRGHQRAQKADHLAAGPRWQDTGLVFTSSTGRHLDPHNIRREWERLTAAAGLEGVVLHELRHTAGSQAVDAGVALTEVADQLGHSDVNMLARTYRHRTRPVVEGVAGVMEDFISKQPKRKGAP